MKALLVGAALAWLAVGCSANVTVDEDPADVGAQAPRWCRLDSTGVTYRVDCAPMCTKLVEHAGPECAIGSACVVLLDSSNDGRIEGGRCVGSAD